jgi:hypothetical protein
LSGTIPAESWGAPDWQALTCARPFDWTLRRLRFSRSAAPSRSARVQSPFRPPDGGLDSPFCPLAMALLIGANAPAGKLRDARLDIASPIGYSLHQRCRSSVVEHSLGKGEVDSSILSGSTTISPVSAFPLDQCLLRASVRSAGRARGYDSGRADS